MSFADIQLLKVSIDALAKAEVVCLVTCIVVRKPFVENVRVDGWVNKLGGYGASYFVCGMCSVCRVQYVCNFRHKWDGLFVFNSYLCI